MKNRNILLFLTLLAPPVFCQGQKQELVDATEEIHEMERPISSNDREKETVQTILHNFANVVGNFFNIVASPNDPQNVGNSIANMLHGMINVAVEAFKNAQMDLNVDQEMLDMHITKLTKKLQKQAAQIIVTKARSMKK